MLPPPIASSFLLSHTPSFLTLLLLTFLLLPRVLVPSGSVPHYLWPTSALPCDPCSLLSRLTLLFGRERQRTQPNLGWRHIMGSQETRGWGGAKQSQREYQGENRLKSGTSLSLRGMETGPHAAGGSGQKGKLPERDTSAGGHRVLETLSRALEC